MEAYRSRSAGMRRPFFWLKTHHSFLYFKCCFCEPSSGFGTHELLFVVFGHEHLRGLLCTSTLNMLVILGVEWEEWASHTQHVISRFPLTYICFFTVTESASVFSPSHRLPLSIHHMPSDFPTCPSSILPCTNSLPTFYITWSSPSSIHLLSILLIGLTSNLDPDPVPWNWTPITELFPFVWTVCSPSLAASNSPN